ncbi:SGNH/GDSL hydrolase family protein [Shewanella intestini]|uniref:SGNH/GDSL hydrolase family protein n=1 Tax=Shewanella intestini TaxID=2017544 RepID=A0ABS5I0A1_9GAMM|nr:MULTISPECIES: SGNH/GDSL hydrolase family protein [Shewanella]MBR9727437.1 SGNH/GDSL hydrolase family protein [Shewanella intestini]MRG35513.1 SGNH/GDSL hydrolase family protein [Shewanella sp. XMDDZSB0408]
MDNALISFLVVLVLSPVFWLQGKYVRFVTTKLPEPTGKRVGRQGKGEVRTLLITGDSAAAGVGVAYQQHALSGQLVDELAQQLEVNWCLEAKNGDNSFDLLKRLQKITAFEVNYAVISIGVNDVTQQTTSQQWLENIEKIIVLLQNKFHTQHILFTKLPPVHAFPALPNPLRWWLGERAKKLNQLLQIKIAKYPAVEFVDIPFEFNLNMMAVDGFHPGSAAYKIWGKDMASRIMIIEQAAKTVA